jgi:hypothetical protein
MKQRFVAGICLFCIFMLSCSSFRQVRPLEKGESRVSISAGGPFTKVGNIYIPMPLVSLGYNYGITEKLDAEAGTNFLAMMYGIAHFDAGVNWRPLKPNRYVPGLIVSPKIFLMTDFRPGDSRIYPDVGLTGWWEIRKYRLVYLGLENFFELSGTREDGNKQQNNWLIAPYTGISLGNKKWQFQFEAKLYTPNLQNNLHTAKNIGVGDHGIFGVFLGVSRSLGGAR